MTRSVRNPQRAMFLVDSYLLDTLIAAVALRVDEAALVHCFGQGQAAELAALILRARGVHVHTLEVSARPGPDDAREVLDTLERLGENWHLHHTGGPDGLTSLLVREAVERGIPPVRCSMLDEERRLLRFDDGDELKITRLIEWAPIRLDEALELAWISQVKTPRIRPEEKFVLRVAESELGKNPLRATLNSRAYSTKGGLGHKWVRRNMPRAIGDRVLAADEAERGLWKQYLVSGWLEDFTALCLQRASDNLEVPCEAKVGVAFHRGTALLELDVIALIGHRPHLISCTTKAGGDACKLKAYEAERRAWQLGGAVARPAVVSRITDDSRPRPPTIEAIFEEPLELFHAADLDVFDWAMLGRWLEAYRRGDRLEELEAWIAAGLSIDTRAPAMVA